MTNDDGAGRDVAIVGAPGALGFGLALRLATAGVSVAIGSRDAERARAAAARATELMPHADVAGLAHEAAVEGGDVVVLSVPFRSHAETVQGLAGAFRAGHVVVDASVPLASAVGGKATRM